jgi:NADH-quinone oxidoreductase subunit N
MNNLNVITSAIYPEIFLLISACVILLVDMFLSDKNRVITYVLSLLSLLGCAILTWNNMTHAGASEYLFYHMFVSDPLANLLKLASYLAVGITFVYARSYATDRDMLGKGLGGEFYVLALFALLGQMVMISGTNMLVIYLGLELMSLCLYALVALRRDHTASTEASMKYFILGALASGFLLYGMSMLYGATGNLDITKMALVVGSATANKAVLVFGVVFIVTGLAFKLGAVPFHMWVPDVYHGSPTAVTLLLGAAPKLAAFAICFRLLVEGLLPIAMDWQQMLGVMAILSIAVGNLAAIAQTNLKRMLAYSTISHMGFMLLGLMSGMVGKVSPAAATNMMTQAYSSSMFYSLTYVLTTLGTFGMIMLLSRSGFEAEELDDLKGLNQRSPWYAFLLLLLMFSLAGIPPMVGFQAKFGVLQVLVDTNQVWLAVYAVVFSLIGAFYYLRVVKLMYFDDAKDRSPIKPNFDMAVVLGANGLAVLVLGLFPNDLLFVCMKVISVTLQS